MELSIKGLTSGHSGVEIDKGRANANVLMARLLHKLASSCPYRIVTLEGGSRETTIAAAVEATLLVDATQTKALCALVKNWVPSSKRNMLLLSRIWRFMRRKAKRTPFLP